MGKDSKITWCDDTFNPWIGCTEVSIERTGGGGCDNCYARVSDARHKWGGATHWGAGVPRHRTAKGAWREPLKWAREAQVPGYAGVSGPGKRLVFCASLADVFDNEVPEHWRTELFDLIAATPSLTWLILTKRIGNAAKMLADHTCWKQYTPLENVWLGASVVNQKEADRDIPALLSIPAHNHFISYEPALAPVNFRNIPARHMVGVPEKYDRFDPLHPHGFLHKIDWLIIGGESGSKRRELNIEGARSVIQDCKDTGTPVFVKQDSNFFPGQQGRFTNEEFALKEFPA